MSRAPEGGIHAYVGEPRTGKTFRAMLDARALAARAGCGVLVLDSTGAGNFIEEHHAPSVAQFLSEGWHGGVAFYTPTHPDAQKQVDAIMSALLSARINRLGPVLVVDELTSWRTDKKSAFVSLCRTWRHHTPGVFVTTQSVTGDLTETFRSLRPHLHLFRSVIPVEYHRAMKWLGVDVQRVASLRDREFLDA